MSDVVSNHYKNINWSDPENRRYLADMIRNYHENINWDSAENKRYLAECERFKDEELWQSAVEELTVYLEGELCDCGDWECVTSTKPGGER